MTTYELDSASMVKIFEKLDYKEIFTLCSDLEISPCFDRDIWVSLLHTRYNIEVPLNVNVSKLAKLFAIFEISDKLLRDIFGNQYSKENMVNYLLSLNNRYILTDVLLLYDQYIMKHEGILSERFFNLFFPDYNLLNIDIYNYPLLKDSIYEIVEKYTNNQTILENEFPYVNEEFTYYLLSQLLKNTEEKEIDLYKIYNMLKSYKGYRLSVVYEFEEILDTLSMNLMMIDRNNLELLYEMFDKMGLTDEDYYVIFTDNQGFSFNYEKDNKKILELVDLQMNDHPHMKFYGF